MNTRWDDPEEDRWLEEPDEQRRLLLLAGSLSRRDLDSLGRLEPLFDDRPHGHAHWLLKVIGIDCGWPNTFLGNTGIGVGFEEGGSVYLETWGSPYAPWSGRRVLEYFCEHLSWGRPRIAPVFRHPPDRHFRSPQTFLRAACCAWVVCRGRLPLEAPFLKEAPPAAVWKVEPLHLWLARRMLGRLGTPASRLEDAVRDFSETGTDATYVVLWQLKNPVELGVRAGEYSRETAWRFIVLLERLARAVGAVNSPDPAWTIPLAGGRLIYCPSYDPQPITPTRGWAEVEIAPRWDFDELFNLAARFQTEAGPDPEQSNRSPGKFWVAALMLRALRVSPKELEAPGRELDRNPEPEAVRELAEKCRQDAKDLRRLSVQLFLQLRCERDPDAATGAAELYAAYLEWWGAPETAASQTLFGRILGEAGFERRLAGKARTVSYLGIRLKA